MLPLLCWDEHTSRFFFSFRFSPSSYAMALSFLIARNLLAAQFFSYSV